MWKSYRAWIMWAAVAVIAAWYLLTDPDGGLQFKGQLQALLGVVVAAPVVYLLRRALMDKTRSWVAAQRAMDNPIGAGLVFLGLCLLTGMLFLAVAPRALAGGLPPGAVEHLPVLKDEIGARWSGLSMPSVLGAQVEQESGWKPTAKLKTAREEGAGLGQFTRAWTPDGRLRFDAIAEVSRLDPSLAGWTWDDPYNVRYQLRAVVVKNRTCYLKLRPLLDDDYNALSMCDAAYNGGLGGVYTERRLCASVKGCDPDRWFGHVELHSGKSRAKWQGYGKSAYEINREHVRNVLVVRRQKYAAWFGEA